MTTSTLTWISPHDTLLGNSDQMNNAQLVANHFAGTSWTKEAVSALCGNMSHESTLNPDLHEIGYNDSPAYGYGLVQWTPETKLTDWCTSQNLDYTKGDSQLARIDYEVNNNIQWIVTSPYNMTFDQFRKNSGGWTVAYLTEAFMNSYERPAPSTADLTDRVNFAQQCYNGLDWSAFGGGSGGSPTPYKVLQQTPQYQYETEGALNNMTYYQVKPGDNLTTISQKYGVPVLAIKQVVFTDIPNKNNIAVGEVLLLPKSAAVPPPQPVYYTVRSGDNLTAIAARFGNTINQLKAWNNIQNENLIKIGQNLRVK